jgi:hypothetical protein
MDYDFDAYLDDITLNTDGLSLTSNVPAINSIHRHQKILYSFEQEGSSEEESDDEVLCLYVTRVEPNTQEDNMGFRVQYIHLVENLQ